MNKKTNFGIIVTVTVMMGAMVLSSCSHEDYFYSEEKAEQTINDKYAAAFEKAFGKVGPNVDWGFSSKSSSTRSFTRAVGTYAQYKGNLQPKISFPSDCDASNFLKESEIPTNASAMPNYQGGVGPYYVDASTTQVDSWSSQCVIYVKGNVDLSNKTFSLNAGAKVYLTEGSTLKLGSYAADGLNIAFYISKGATLETDGLLKIQTYPVYNHGTIKAESYEITSSSILYNVGKLETTGKTAGTGNVIVNANNDRIVNDGTIDCAEVIIHAGAVQNNDQWNVSGNTHINSNNSGWVNNGHWTTGNYAYIGGSENVINNCFLEVENDFEMNISSETGAFKIDGGGGVLTNNFYGGRDSSTGAISGPFRINMGANAVFVVKNTAQFESGRGDDEGFGIFGVSSVAPAVFQAKDIVRDPTLLSQRSHGAVTYGGNLYVSAETHFAQGDDGSKPFIYVKDGFSINNNIYAAGFKSGKPSITIPQTPCSPGFQGGDSKPTYRVIAEDLSATEAGDFDFNDVVFDVEPNEAGTAAKIVVRAAGGIYKLTVASIEVHEAFGQGAKADGTYSMINTQPWNPEVKATLFGAYSGDFSSDAAIRNTIKGIEIKVYKPGFEENGIVLTANTGMAACKILVDDSFVPVSERRNISDQYGYFTNYVRGQFQNDFWWK